MIINKTGYRLAFSKKGNMTILTNQSDEHHHNVIHHNSTSFALPFDRSTQQRERSIRLRLLERQQDKITFIGKNVRQDFRFYDHYFTMHTTFSKLRGPRSGVNFDFAFLDSDDYGFEHNLMLTDMYIDPHYLYGYFLFRQYNGQYIVMAINERFTAYRLKYSYFGHRITGMQILSNASDVIYEEDRTMLLTDSLHITIGFQPNVQAAKTFAAEILNISIASYELSGNMVGNDFSFSIINDFDHVRIIDEEGYEVPFEERNSGYSFRLGKD